MWFLIALKYKIALKINGILRAIFSIMNIDVLNLLVVYFIIYYRV